jgi:hypothetical protein
MAEGKALAAFHEITFSPQGDTPMATFAIEYIDNFADVRASGAITGGGEDLSIPYYLMEWFRADLRNAGHQLLFVHSNKEVGERVMRDSAFGGDDEKVADTANLFFMITHGNYHDRECDLLYDTQRDDWISTSRKWRFGETCQMKWLLIYGCHTINLDDVPAHLHIFQRLHLMCGAYGDMFDSWTIDHAGDSVANNLLAGKTVSDSWGDGVSDWWVSNHPAVISVELQWTYNNGNPLWEETVIGCDHLLGVGAVLSDVKPGDQYWMAASWWTGGIYG